VYHIDASTAGQAEKSPAPAGDFFCVSACVRVETALQYQHVQQTTQEQTMITVTLEYGTPAAKVAQVEEFLREQQLRNADFNGVEFSVELGEYTQLDNQSPGVGEEDACTLYYSIQNILAGY